MKKLLITSVTTLMLLPGLLQAAVVDQYFFLTSNSYYSYSATDYDTYELVTETYSLSGFLIISIDDINNTVTLDYSNVLREGSPFRANEALITDSAGLASGTLLAGFTGEDEYNIYGNAEFSVFPQVCIECGYEMMLNLDAYTTNNPLALSYHEYNPYDTGEAHFELYISEVPLPGAAWLFGTGLLGLLGFFRRKDSSCQLT